jgi:TolB-like protein
MKRHFPVMLIRILAAMLAVASTICGQTTSVSTDSVTKAATAAVMDFEARGLAMEQAATLSDRFRAELAGCKQVRQVERSRMDEILREQGFQQSGCTSTECAVQTGRLLGVEKMISGSVSRIGETWTVQARVIDVGTSEILKTAILDERGAIDELLTPGMAKLAEKLVGGCAVQPEPVRTGLPAALHHPEPLRIIPAPGDTTGGLGFQFAFMSPVAFPAGNKINGIALSLPYGRLESLRGIQAGVLNQVTENVNGIQAGVVNISGDDRGLQAGVFNMANDVRGLQGGVVNISTSSKGIQAGLVNITGNCRCLQVGLINIWKTADGATWFFPIVGGLR